MARGSPSTRLPMQRARHSMPMYSQPIPVAHITRGYFLGQVKHKLKKKKKKTMLELLLASGWPEAMPPGW
jgi:hypothetical protein